MKKVIEELASRNGIFTSYQGSTRIMYLSGEKASEFRIYVRGLYPNLAFELKLQSEADAEKEQQKVQPTLKKLETLPDSFIHTEELALAEAIAKDFSIPAKFGEKIEIKGQIGEGVELPKKVKVSDETRKAVDEYIVSAKVKKGEYKETAEKFGVTTEYVRGRYRKFTEKVLREYEIGLLENEIDNL